MVSPRIRKFEHELTRLDFEQFPMWEYALDEEGEPGQDETTMRPLQIDAVGRAFVFGMLGALFRLADGREFFGALTIGRGMIAPFDIQAMWPFFRCPPGKNVGLSLPGERALDFDAARERASEIYTRLGCMAEGMFPLTIRPMLPIKGMDAELRIDGFMRPADRGRVEIIV